MSALGAGVNITQQKNINEHQSGGASPSGTGFAAATAALNGSTGFAGVLSVGWGFGNGLRAEIEGNYRNNKARGSLTAPLPVSALAGGTDGAEVRWHGQRAV